MDDLLSSHSVTEFQRDAMSFNEDLIDPPPKIWRLGFTLVAFQRRIDNVSGWHPGGVQNVAFCRCFVVV